MKIISYTFLILGISLSQPLFSCEETTTNVSSIATGSTWSFIIDKNGDVYNFGFSRWRYQKVYSDECQFTPKKIAKLQGKKIICLKTQYHSLALTGDGEVYAFGRNDCGQLGFASKFKNTPKKIPGLKKKIIDIAVGWSFSLLLDESGKLYFIGKLEDYCQKKLALTRPYFKYKSKSIKAFKNKKIISIHAYDEMALLLDDKGDIYGFGNNKNCLANHHHDCFFMPTNEPLFSSLKNIVQLSISYEHFLALDNKGIVYSFGKNHRGELGHGHWNKINEPTKIAALDGIKIIKVAAGVCFSLVLDEQGRVYSFGYGDYGQLGHGKPPEHHSANHYWPTLIEALKGKKIVDIAAGLDRAMVVDEHGIVYSFGQGKYGQLGHGDEREDQFMPKAIDGIEALGLTKWSPTFHVYQPKKIRDFIKTMMLIRYRLNKNQMKNIKHVFLPKVILFEIFKYI